MQTEDFVVRFAGEGGQGVVTASEMLGRAAASVGYYIQTFATFPSQIMGGPTWTQSRISTTPVQSPGDDLDGSGSVNLEAYETHKGEVREGGVILHDSAFEILSDSRAIGIPFDGLAKQAGEARSANMVMIGGLAHLVNMPLSYFEEFVRRRFRGRDAIIESNVKALGLGHEHAATSEMQLGELGTPVRPEWEQVLLKGNEALSLGAMAAWTGLLRRVPHLTGYHHPRLYGEEPCRAGKIRLSSKLRNRVHHGYWGRGMLARRP